MKRQLPGEHLRPDQLVERVVPSDVLADRDQLTARGEQGRGMQPAGLIEGASGQRASRSGRARITVRGTTGPSGSGSQRKATSSIDALPQIPHDAVATKWRSATAESSNGRDSRTTIVSSGWLRSTGSPGSVHDDLGPVDQPLRPQEPDRQLVLVPGCPHRDGHRDRLLVGAGGADLERRLADDPIGADLERAAAHRHDGPGRDVPGRRRVVAYGPGRRVARHRSRNTSVPIGRRQCVELIAW